MWFIGAWYISTLVAMFLAVCLFMILVILIQRPRGGGLSGAFGGGGGSTQAAFGAKTGDVLTWFTVFCFTAFLILAMGLTWAINPQIDGDQPGIEATADQETSTPPDPIFDDDTDTLPARDDDAAPAESTTPPPAPPDPDPESAPLPAEHPELDGDPTGEDHP